MPSSLKRELVEDLDILIVRELTGGGLFRRAQGDRHPPKDGQKRAVDTQLYTTGENRDASPASPSISPAKRSNKVSSAEKHNVMKSGVL